MREESEVRGRGAGGWDGGRSGEVWGWGGWGRRTTKLGKTIQHNSLSRPETASAGHVSLSF